MAHHVYFVREFACVSGRAMTRIFNVREALTLFSQLVFALSSGVCRCFVCESAIIPPSAFALEKIVTQLFGFLPSFLRGFGRVGGFICF